MGRRVQESRQLVLPNPGVGATRSVVVDDEEWERLKKIFNEQVRAAGVERVEQIVITSLLTRDEKTVGATGFDRRTGAYHVFRAKTVVLAMGAHQSRWHTNSTKNPYNIWQYPWNTGTQISVAYEAGAKVRTWSSVWLPRYQRVLVRLGSMPFQGWALS